MADASTKVKRPFAQVQPIAKELLALLSPSCERISVAGSIRRLCADIGDIELCAIPRIEKRAVQRGEPDFWSEPVQEHFNLLWSQLDGLSEKMGLRFEKIKWGEKYRAFRWPLTSEIGSIQVDLFTSMPDNHGLILLIRTGSAQFSQHVVARLKQNGTPSKDGYVRDSKGAAISTPTEAEVFRLASMRYYPPEERSW